MKTLPPDLRRQLARTAADARDVAEAGARATLQALAVHEHEPYGHMDAGQRALRRQLRAHARQIGDPLDARSGGRAIEGLVQECAYEHWHGMLFARYLIENHLLIEPEMGIAVTLDECEELAKDEGADKWALAARFAHRMLPQVFRPDLPVFGVRFAREHRLKLEGLVEGLPAEMFKATDSLGWVYQFWQSRKKAEVNRSEVKVGAGELPAVTQLFTEPYMVSFLLDNTLGAWWAARCLNGADLEGTGGEAELRRKATIPGVPLDYLRFVQREDAVERTGWRSAAGAFGGWPGHPGELKILDPCCGSGHFLVAAFLMLAPMRMAREGLAARDAVDAVLRDNLHGLELDPRCVEIAVFALALAAWTYPGAEGYRPLPELNIACSGLAPNATKEQWIALARIAAAVGGMPPASDLFDVEDTLLSAPLRNSLGVLYDLFGQAPERGSLIDPHVLKADLFQSDFESVRTLFAAALEQERMTEGQAEHAVAAQGMARAAELLAGRYHLVVTNVPYLARGKQNETLRAFCQQHYPAAKNDLATVFLERCLALCEEGGTASLVLPQNWLFLTSYRRLREKLLKTETWHLLARLGEGGFDSSAAAGAFVALLTLSRGHPAGHSGGLFDDASAAGTMYGLDVSESRTTSEKAEALRCIETITAIKQNVQLDHPDVRISFGEIAKQLLINFARSWQGIVSSDDNKFVFRFWEIDRKDPCWMWLQQPPQDTKSFVGRSGVIRWEQGNGALHNNSNAHNFPSLDMLGRPGLAFQRMRDLNVTLFDGSVFADHVAPIVPNDERQIAAIWCYATSEFREEVRKIDSTLKASVGSFVKVPFDLERWTQIAQKRYPNGLPRPYSDDPTQWIFHGHPCGSVVWDEIEKRTVHGPLRTDPTVLQVAVARLSGYRWPAEQDAGMELADEQREWVRRCETLHTFPDEDGIVCIPPVRGEPPAGERVQQLLAAAFGDAWSDSALTRLLTEASSPSLDDWLRNRFFDQHCKLFHHRPFVWHVWDGRKRDGFHALVNYHKLAEGDGRGRQILEALTYSYLGDWINRQQDGVKRAEGGAEDRLAAALELRKRLVAILEGEPPHDLFIRWKSIEAQPIGWEPDVNDGVRLNIRPFMAADLPGGKKGAGILRAKPNVHWRKDRGREPFREQQRFPWFWRDGEFMAERGNDVHLSVEKKRTERERIEAQS